MAENNEIMEITSGYVSVESVELEETNIETNKEVVDTKDNNEIDVDVAEVIKDLHSMNYIELSKFKNDIEAERQNLIGAMNLIKSIEEMGNNEETDDTKKIALSNIFEDSEFLEDTSKFKESYNVNITKLDTIKSEIEKEIEKYNCEKGTKFLTDQMIELLNKKLDACIKNNALAFSIEIVKNTLDAYKNRTNLSYILNQIKDSRLLCDVKADVVLYPDKTVIKSNNEFAKYFTEHQIEMFDKYVIENFNNDEYAMKVFKAHLARILNKGKNQGKHNYVKVIVMNALDIVENVYDLEGGKEAFDNQLKEMYSYYKKMS